MLRPRRARGSGPGASGDPSTGDPGGRPAPAHCGCAALVPAGRPPGPPAPARTPPLPAGRRAASALQVEVRPVVRVGANDPAQGSRVAPLPRAALRSCAPPARTPLQAAGSASTPPASLDLLHLGQLRPRQAHCVHVVLGLRPHRVLSGARPGPGASSTRAGASRRRSRGPMSSNWGASRSIRSRLQPRNLTRR